jgi:hypothetical protein
MVSRSSSPLGEVDTVVRNGARVVWIDAAMLDRVPAERAQGWYRAGVLEGTMADVSELLGLGSNAPGWIQPGSGRPVFARAMPNGQSSDWLTVSWRLARSHSR